MAHYSIHRAGATHKAQRTLISVFALVVIFGGAAGFVSGYIYHKNSVSKQALVVVDGRTSNEQQQTTVVTPVVPELAISKNPLKGSEFYVNRTGNAVLAYDNEQNAGNKKLLEKIATKPIGTWVVGSTDFTKLSPLMEDAQSNNKVPVLVLYNIPKLGCGSGGAQSAEAYKAWVDGLSSAIDDTKVVAVIEPDAIALQECLTAQESKTRHELIKYAVATLNKNSSLTYIDAGHSDWVKDVDTLASRLKEAGIAEARGISTNVSNYQTTKDSIDYSQKLMTASGAQGAVIDTSRNGVGPTLDKEWCNAPSRRLGPDPSATDIEGIDAYLWIKYPGESDGSCNGGTPEGTWWLDYALELAK